MSLIRWGDRGRRGGGGGRGREGELPQLQSVACRRNFSLLLTSLQLSRQANRSHQQTIRSFPSLLVTVWCFTSTSDRNWPVLLNLGRSEWSSVWCFTSTSVRNWPVLLNLGRSEWSSVWCFTSTSDRSWPVLLNLGKGEWRRED